MNWSLVYTRLRENGITGFYPPGVPSECETDSQYRLLRGLYELADFEERACEWSARCGGERLPRSWNWQEMPEFGGDK